MPTYGYECKTCKEQFETVQRITEDALTVHDGCGGELRRLLYPVGIVFKGPGFYVNDYAKASKAEKKPETAASAKTDSANDSSESGGKAETKPEAKTESKADSTPSAAPPASASASSGS